MDTFGLIAPYYDKINGEAYIGYAEFLDKCFRTYSDIKVTEVLDLGCGTGGITRLMSDKGYDMVGVDNSPEMLSVAKESSPRPTGRGNDLLYVCQDMRQLDLFGTVQGAYAAFDTLNYLNSPGELKGVFSLLRTFIEPGGILVFDLNTEYRYKTVFAENSYVYEFDRDMLIWQNLYNPNKKEVFFYLTLFSPIGDGYQRLEQTQKQRYFPPVTVKRLLKEAGFSLAETFGDLDFSPPGAENEKIYYIAKAI